MPQEMLFAPMDWSRYTVAARALEANDRVALAALLSGSVTWSDPDGQRLLPMLEQTGGPAGLLLPLGLRLNPASYAERAADWLLPLDEPLRAEALADCCSAAAPTLLPISRHMLLGFYSETYRLVATGTYSEDAPRDAAQYDGPPALLRALGGALYPPQASSRVLAAEQVADIAAALARVRGGEYPAGDMGVWNDYAEDFYDPETDLQQLCRDLLGELQKLYAEAARLRQGVRLWTD